MKCPKSRQRSQRRSPSPSSRGRRINRDRRECLGTITSNPAPQRKQDLLLRNARHLRVGAITTSTTTITLIPGNLLRPCRAPKRMRRPNIVPRHPSRNLSHANHSHNRALPPLHKLQPPALLFLPLPLQSPTFGRRSRAPTHGTMCQKSIAMSTAQCRNLSARGIGIWLLAVEIMVG